MIRNNHPRTFLAYPFPLYHLWTIRRKSDQLLPGCPERWKYMNCCPSQVHGRGRAEHRKPSMSVHWQGAGQYAWHNCFLLQIIRTFQVLQTCVVYITRSEEHTSE